MNILVVTQYFYPERFRINDICVALASAGHKVTVVTGIPNYPEGEVFAGYEQSYKAPQEYNGVTVIRCNNRPRYRGVVNLVRNYLSFVRKASKVVTHLTDDFDAVFVYELSPITLAIPAIRYKKKYRKPMYLYCLDLWPESIRDAFGERILSTKHPFYKIIKYISSKIYQAADAIGVKSEAFETYLTEVCGVKKEKIRFLAEHAESLYLEIDPTPTDNGCFDFVFLGNIGRSQNCEIILKAIPLIQTDRPFQVHFVGDGSGLDKLQQQTVQMGLQQKVVFHGSFPLEQLAPFYQMADACLLTLSDETDISLTPPGKLYGYMAASRPVVAAAGGATKEALQKYDCGVCVAAGDAEGLARQMTQLIEDPAQAHQMGQNGRKHFLQNYTIDIYISNLEKQLDSLIHDGEIR